MEEHATLRQRDGLPVGRADDITWDGLVKMGWIEYTGTAQTDELGYIIPGTDENVVPTPWPGPNSRGARGRDK